MKTVLERVKSRFDPPDHKQEVRTKTVLERVKSRFDPLEQQQTDRETDRAAGTGEGSGTKPDL